jgi:hypothetical protein
MPRSTIDPGGEDPHQDQGQSGRECRDQQEEAAHPIVARASLLTRSAPRASSYAPSLLGCSGGRTKIRWSLTYVRWDLPSIICCLPELPTEIRLGFAFSATGIASVRTPFS